MSIKVIALTAEEAAQARALVAGKTTRNKKGCWISTTALSEDGYSSLCFKGQSYRGHRLSYAAYKGNLSTKLQIDHLCRTRNCLNPDHLEQVSSKTNLLRGVSLMAQNARKDKCKRGHELSGSNLTLKTYRKGKAVSRVCKACHRMHQKDYLRRSKWLSDGF